jgi:hypothetical protein
VPFRCDLATGHVGVAWGAVVEGLVGSGWCCRSGEPVDFDGAGVAVVDGSAVEVLVLEGAEEPLDDAVDLRALDSGADVAQQRVFAGE